MANLENSNLVLKTIDLPVNSLSAVGSTDTYMRTLTWNNINIRQVLGSMYDRYDKFNICLNNVSSGYGDVATTTNPEDRNVVIKMSGLNFLNNTYDSSKLHMTGAAVLGTMQFNVGATAVGATVVNTTSTQYFYAGNYITFGKSADTVNLTITYEPVSSATFAHNWTFPECVFIFKIFGIPNDIGFKNTSRI